MKKRLAIFLLMALLDSVAWAGPWGIVVNMNSKNISTIDLGQTPPKVYGPFLTGSLGTTDNSLLDVAVTPDSRYALVSSFVERKVYQIDITDPTNPVLTGSITLSSFSPEDIAISPNGRFAVISDGSFIRQLVFIDLSNFSKYNLYTMTTSNISAQAAAIGNDNSTIILCDYYYSRIVYGVVNATFSGFISESNLPAETGPLNITISPDGSTALIANPGGFRIGVYQILSPGILVPGSTPSITGFRDRPQSIAFSPDGKKAYVICSNTAGSLATFAWLQVNGPGNVTLGGERVADLTTYTYYEYFGIDTLAVSPDGKYAIAGCPGTYIHSSNRVSLINLSNYKVTAIEATLSDPRGVAIFNEIVYAPSNLSLSRLTNNYIFYKEYINSVAWQPNAKNKDTISNYRIYRKVKDAADSTYQPLADVDASTFQYMDRGLKKNNFYTYRITSVNSRGIESAPAEIGN